MKITVKNFKQYPEYSLELPDVGLVLLRGETGKGKTTIFEAAYDAITGLAEDVVPWTGEKPVEVSLEFNAIKIRRTHNPETLWCEISLPLHEPVDGANFLAAEYTGEAAQAKIYEYFTAQTAEFTAAYYIRQRMENSLLSFGPAQMLRFIQKMAFGDQDPETYKQKIKTQIDGRLILKQQEEFKAAEASKRVLALSARLEADQQALGQPPVEPFSQEEFSIIQTSHAALVSRSVELNQSLKKLDSDEYKEANKARAQYAIEKATFDKINQNNRIRIKEIETELNDLTLLPWPTQSEAECLTKIASMASKRKYLYWKAEVSAFGNEIRKEYPFYQSKAVDFLTERLSVLQSDLTSNTEILKDRSSALFTARMSSKVQRCPICETPLTIEGGSFVTAEHCDPEANREHAASISALIIVHEAMRDELQKKIANTKSLLSQAVRLKNNAMVDPDSSITNEDEVEALTKTIEDTIRVNRDKATKYHSLESDLKNLKRKTLSTQEEFEALGETIRNAQKSVIPSAEEIQAMRDNTRQALDLCLQDTNILQAKMVAFNSYQSQKTAWSKMAKLVDDRAKELDTESQTAGEIINNVKVFSDRWAGAVRLKELSDSAAISATESVIQAINHYAEQHIATLFPHGGTSVRINSGSTTAKGEERSKLSLSVIHKGQTVGKTINPLSGGEKDRVKVAFQLALAEIYRAQFMILDEPFAGIDIENTLEICLALLKEFSAGRLIVIAQHGAPEGVFDLVLNL